MDDLENKIQEKAREAFVENGYNETSMSDIALRVGINRPTLHYYFRTKDKLFQSVFGSIILRLIPQIKEVVSQQQRPVGDRVSDIVDLYYGVFIKNPSLPVFAFREVNRDVDRLISTLESVHAEEYMFGVVNAIREEMAEGKMRQMPAHLVFYTFYGLLTIPFLTRELSRKLILGEDDFTEMLNDWKKTIVRQMSALLEP